MCSTHCWTRQDGKRQIPKRVKRTTLSLGSSKSQADKGSASGKTNGETGPAVRLWGHGMQASGGPAKRLSSLTLDHCRQSVCSES